MRLNTERIACLPISPSPHIFISWNNAAADTLNNFSACFFLIRRQQKSKRRYDKSAFANYLTATKIDWRHLILAWLMNIFPFCLGFCVDYHSCRGQINIFIKVIVCFFQHASQKKKKKKKSSLTDIFKFQRYCCCGRNITYGCTMYCHW